MDSLSFPSRPLQKPRVRRSTYFVRSFVRSFSFSSSLFFFFSFSFTFSSIVSSAVCSLVFHFKSFPFYLAYLAFLRRKAPEFDSTEIQKILLPPPPPSLPDSSISSTSTELDRAVSGTDDRFERSTNVNQLQLSTAITNLLFITIIVITMFIIIINIIIRFFFSCLALLNIIY